MLMADCTELQAAVAEIAYIYAGSELLPKNTSVVDWTVAKVRSHFPELTHEEITDAVTAYQESKRVASDPLAKQLAAFKTSAQVEPRLKTQLDRLENILKDLPVEPTRPAERRAAAKAVKLMRDIERNLKSDVLAKKRISEIEKKIKTMDLSLANVRREGPKTRLQAQRDELNKELDKLRGNERRKVELGRQIEDMLKQLRSGVFSTPEARAKAAVDAETQKLLFERDLLKARINQRIRDLSPYSISDILNAPGSFMKLAMTTLDFSFIGRQGAGALLTGQWRLARDAFMSQFKVWKSDEALAQQVADLYDRPNGPIYRKTKLEFAGHMEELEGRFIQPLLNWTQLSRFDRAFAGAGNRLRADLFDTLYSSLGDNPTIEEANDIARLVETMTLRRHVTGAEKANIVLFSARAMASRLAWMTFEPVWGPLVKGAWSGKGARWRSSRVAAKQYGRYLIGSFAVWLLGAMTGMLGSKDPRSSDFLKLKVGNTRIDPFAGLTQYITFAARIVTGETVPSHGEPRPTPLRGPDVKFGKREMSDVIFDFINSKLSPIASLASEAVRDKEFGGAPFDVRRAMLTRTMPLILNDIYEVMKGEGLAKGTILSIMALLGIGVNHYEQGQYGHSDKLPDFIIRMFGGTPNQLRPKPKKY